MFMHIPCFSVRFRGELKVNGGDITQACDIRVIPKGVTGDSGLRAVYPASTNPTPAR
jgi:hypothetical protein